MDVIDSILASIKAGSFAADDAETSEIEFKTDGRSIKDDLANLAEAAHLNRGPRPTLDLETPASRLNQLLLAA